MLREALLATASALIVLGLDTIASATAVNKHGWNLTTPNVTTNNGATTSGSRFNIDNVTGYFAGTNSYWLPFLTNNIDVDLVFSHLNSSGLRILRVWGFNDVATKPSAGTVYFQLLSASGSTINTDTDGLQRLDYVVSAAEKYGVKLIINFVNNWPDYGGMPAYVKAFGGTQQGWYTNEAAQAQYRKYIAAVVSRYMQSSAIFAWELANEPRCQGCSTDVIFNWASNTSAYIRSLDGQRMIAIGDEGFGLSGATSYPYGYSEGLDFVKNLGIKDISFGTIHFYPSSWGVPNTSGPQWIQDHATACMNAQKPCLLEEYGITSDHCNVEGPWQNASLALTAGGMGGDMFWQWGDTLGTGQSSNDGNTIYYGSKEAQCLVTNHVAAIQTRNQLPQ